MNRQYGIHRYKAAKAEGMIAEGGKTQYCLVCPELPEYLEHFAAQEFKNFFAASTGAELEVVPDACAGTDAKFISIGSTSFARAAVADDLSFLGANGFVIRTVGRNIYVRGGGAQGTLNGVYELLHRLIGYRFYCKDEIFYRRRRSVALKNFDIADAPDFQWREVNYGEAIADEVLCRRLRFNVNEEIYLFGHRCHNSFLVIPPSEYMEAHRDWYSPEGDQLCYSSEEMTAQYIENLKPYILKSKAEIVLMGQEDNEHFCTCGKCSRKRELYGTDSAAVIQFANKVAAGIRDWLQREHPERQPVRFGVFAYYKTKVPPVRPDGKGGMAVADESVRCAPDVGIMYAPIEATFPLPFDRGKNRPYYEYLKNWSLVTDNLFIWAYSAYFANYFLCYNSFDNKQYNYKLYLQNNARIILDETEHDQGVSTHFGRLSCFLQANLQWNAAQDPEKLTDEFFSRYFAGAGPSLRRYFDELRAHLTGIESHPDFNGHDGQVITRACFWPKEMLLRWAGYVNDSLSCAEKIADRTRRKKITDRILLESLPILYMLVLLYKDDFDRAAVALMKNQFRERAVRLGISRFREFQPNLFAFWAEWENI